MTAPPEDGTPKTSTGNGHAAVAEVDATPARPPVPAPGARSALAADYRLRGLDLDAHVFAEARTRPRGRKHPSVRRRRRRHLLQFLVVLAVVALVVVVLRATVLQPYSVTSSSMAPALPSGTQVLVMKQGLLSSAIDQGDIVVVEKPAGVTCRASGDQSDQLIARVIAMPGQTIRSERGRISIDGERLHEPGWYDHRYGETGPADIAATKVPPGSYFVMGDNRHAGCDSRTFGAVPESAIDGKVVATLTRDGHVYVQTL